MHIKRLFFVLILGLCLSSAGYGSAGKATGKIRMLVVDSYHAGYNWSEDTQQGFCGAMLKFGYFDHADQIGEFTRNDYLKTSRAVLKKLWMDSKRKKSKLEKERKTLKLIKIAEDFKPDIIFLGDDNAAKYVGNQFLDTSIPIVFWGLNNTPVKYGLVNSMDKPGHNVTGVYQSGYYLESLRLLKRIAPSIKTLAVLADDSPTGRAILKAVEHLNRKKILPLKLIGKVSTDDYGLWQKKALELQQKADAFYVAQYNALKDESGNYVPNMQVARWYLTHIRIPETAVAGQFVRQGMMCSADDAGYNQGFEAVVIAHDILANSAVPAIYPPRSPKRGALMVNRQRAGILGIKLREDMGIEKYIEEASALKVATGKNGGKQ